MTTTNFVTAWADVILDGKPAGDLPTPANVHERDALLVLLTPGRRADVRDAAGALVDSSGKDPAANLALSRTYFAGSVGADTGRTGRFLLASKEVVDTRGDDALLLTAVAFLAWTCGEYDVAVDCSQRALTVGEDPAQLGMVWLVLDALGRGMPAAPQKARKAARAN